MTRLAVAALFCFLSMAAGQVPTVPASAGVYDEAQAQRGRVEYERACASCHGRSLDGGVATALRGERFASAWNGITLDRLFERVSTMPPNAPVKHDEETSIALVAFLLSANGYPPGGPLATARLAGIRLESSAGPAEVPNFALVQVVGCLTRKGEREWLVTDATETLRTKDPDASTGDGISRALALPRGNEVFRAMNPYPSPETLVGHTVEVKGFLIRGAVNALNVTSLASLSPRCDR